MFDKFESHFRRDSSAVESASTSTGEQFGLTAFFGRYGGASFNSGLYRVVTPKVGQLANEFIRIAFPKYAEKVACFASDWLGRLFCLDSARLESGGFGVVMLEPGTAEVLVIPANLHSFHEEELIGYTDAALAATFFQQWQTHGGPAPQPDQCVGYRKPLFLGGSDTLDNLELTDLDVYWTISAQLIQRVRGLPPGTKIQGVSLS